MNQATRIHQLLDELIRDSERDLAMASGLSTWLGQEDERGDLTDPTAWTLACMLQERLAHSTGLIELKKLLEQAGSVQATMPH